MIGRVLTKPTNSIDWQSANQTPPGQSEESNLDCTQLALEPMVAHPTPLPDTGTDSTATSSEPAHRRREQPSSSNSIEEDEPASMFSLGDLLIARGVSQLSSAIICQSWRPSTLKSYSSAWKKWVTSVPKKDLPP